MEDYRKINILEDIENISKEIQLTLIEQIRCNVVYKEKLNKLYIKLDTLNLELRRIIPPQHNENEKE